MVVRAILKSVTINTYQYMLICTKYTQIHTNIYQNLPIHINTYQYLPICTNTHQYIQIHTNIILKHTKTYQNRTNMRQYIPRTYQKHTNMYQGTLYLRPWMANRMQRSPLARLDVPNISENDQVSKSISAR